MKGIGILFPGQGVQYVGLLNQFICSNSLKDNKVKFFDTDIADIVKDYDDLLTEKIKNKISDLLIIYVNDSEESIKNKTTLLKSSLMTQYSVQLFNHIRFNTFMRENKNGYSTFHVFGRSLGELSAFMLSSSLSNKACAEITYERGVITEEVNKDINGKMINLIGESDVILHLFNEYKSSKSNDNLSLAGIHSKRLIVVCGLNEEILKFQSYISIKSKEIDKKIIIKDLNVQGIFHNQLLKNAEERFFNFLSNKKYDFKVKNQMIRHTTVNTLQSLNINSADSLINNNIYKILSKALVEPYDTNSIFLSLSNQGIETLDLAMNKIINYNDYIYFIIIII